MHPVHAPSCFKNFTAHLANSITTKLSEMLKKRKHSKKLPTEHPVTCCRNPICK